MIENGKFKFFSIDLQLKILFAFGTTVELLKNANIDNYIEFKAIENVRYFHQNNFINVPVDKS